MATNTLFVEELERRKTVANLQPKPSRNTLLERVLSRFFPPAPLSELGKMDASTKDYLYRTSRTGIERNPAVYSMYVKLGPVVAGEAPPPPPPQGTAASRALIQA